MKKYVVAVTLIALFAVIGYFQSCSKQESVNPATPTVEYIMAKSAQGVHFTDAQCQAAVEQKAMALVTNSQTDYEVQSVKNDSTGIVHLGLPRMFSAVPYWYPMLSCDGGSITIASFSCKIKGDSTIKFTGLNLETTYPFINWSGYYKAYAINPQDSSEIAFCAFTLTNPHTFAFDPLMQIQPSFNLFWLSCEGSGEIYWEDSDPNNIACSYDGMNDYLRTIVNGFYNIPLNP